MPAFLFGMTDTSAPAIIKDGAPLSRQRSTPHGRDKRTARRLGSRERGPTIGRGRHEEKNP